MDTHLIYAVLVVVQPSAGRPDRKAHAPTAGCVR